VKILEIDSERRRLSLSVKRVEGQVLEPKVLPPEELAAMSEGDAGAGDLDDVPELGLSEEVFAGSTPPVAPEVVADAAVAEAAEAELAEAQAAAADIAPDPAAAEPEAIAADEPVATEEAAEEAEAVVDAEPEPEAVAPEADDPAAG
jgi:small subunit ribosomal protein S1